MAPESGGLGVNGVKDGNEGAWKDGTEGEYGCGYDTARSFEPSWEGKGGYAD